MKRQYYETAKTLYEEGYRYKYIMQTVPVSYRTLKRWKSSGAWGNGVDRRKFNYHPFGNQNAKGHGAPYGNRNAVKHGLYDAGNMALLQMLRDVNEYLEEVEKAKEQEIERYGSHELWLDHQKKERVQFHDELVNLVQNHTIDYNTFSIIREKYDKGVQLRELKRILHENS